MAGPIGRIGTGQRTIGSQDLKIGEDFPFLCETCLGPNPYVRMLKMPASRECKVASRPYNAFRWKAGPQGRYKETVICVEVAMAKNVCQCCLMDMDYNLPAGVIDSIKEEAGIEGINPPESDVNKEFYWEEKRRAMENGEFASQAGKIASEKLSRLSRSTPYYDRNLAKLCSFWLKGTCNRVLTRECPFRPCNGIYRFPELASGYQELMTQLIRQLNDEGPVTVMKNLDEEIREKLIQSQQGSRSENIRNRYMGKDDPLTKKYLARIDKMPSLTAPEDTSIVTLYVGGLSPDITRDDLHGAFYGYGEIASLTMNENKNCAFVAYTTRAQAEDAANAVGSSIHIKGTRCNVRWGLSKAERGEGGGPSTSTATPGAGGPPPPPGANFFNQGAMPPPPGMAQGRAAYYPSMDPNMMGARLPSASDRDTQAQ